MTRYRLLHGAAMTVLVLLGVALVLGTGYLGNSRPELALAVAAAVLVLGVAAVEPMALPLAAIAGFLVTARVSAGGVDLTTSDALLAAAAIPAALMSPRPFARELRALLWLDLIYQLCSGFAVVLYPYPANAIEWMHALLLISGSLMVGWAVAARGRAALGGGILLGVGAVLAVAVCIEGTLQWIGGNFEPLYPSWPFDMHKNSVGCSLGMLAALAYARPVWLHVQPRAALALTWLFSAGLMFTQSRQAVVGLAVILLVAGGRGVARHGWAWLLRIISIPLIIVTLVTVRTQVQSGNEFNSFFQRLDWFEESFAIWSTSPLFGVGLRWWYTDRFDSAFQPPNAFVEVLTTGGIVGLIGFVILMVGAVVVLRRMDPLYGTAALLVLVSRLVQSQLDLFWVSVQSSLPFLVAGLATGAYAFAQRERDEEEAKAASAGPARISAPRLGTTA